jgi:histone acetyltransferase (RNA polymerase elongator complex component)
MMKKRPLIIPIFIAQEGCRHRCVYCDQRTISGVSHPGWSPSSIQRQVQSYLSRPGRYPVQVAFYGGSFTTLPEARQRFFLDSVQEFLQSGQVHSLRLSTRPDAIEDDNLRLLKSMGVTIIEMGVQSLSDRVLSASGRGHSSSEVYRSALRIHRHGFELGVQLMPGLPGDSHKTFLQTVNGTLDLRADFVRIYPTVVLAGTLLEKRYHQNRYTPLSLDEAVDWCKEAKNCFALADIPVIRMGLQSTASLERAGRIVSGPYHPAFGQLVHSAIWYERITPSLKKASRHSLHLVIHAPANQLADIHGHQNGNFTKWLNKFQLLSLKAVGSSLPGPENFRITPREKRKSIPADS